VEVAEKALPAVALAGAVTVKVAAAPGKTLIDGLEAMAVSAPLAVDFSVVVHEAAPTVPVAVAVSPPVQLPPEVAP